MSASANRLPLRGVGLSAALLGVMLVLMAASLLVGQVMLPLGATLDEWLRGAQTPATLIVTELRMPRAVLAALVGASLGLSGAVLQGLLRNPLAEPGVM